MSPVYDAEPDGNRPATSVVGRLDPVEAEVRVPDHHPDVVVSLGAGLGEAERPLVEAGQLERVHRLEEDRFDADRGFHVLLHGLTVRRADAGREFPLGRRRGRPG